MASIMSSAIMLSPTDHTRWKHFINSTALSLGAFDALTKDTEPYPGATDSDEKKENREWKKAAQKIAGTIYATLDEAHQAIVAGIDPTNAKALWEKLNGQYEKKDIGGRFFAMQNLMAISYRDAEHPTESLLEFGNRVVDGSKKLRNLIPEEAKYVAEKENTPASGVCNDASTHKVTVTPATVTPSSFNAGFTASMLIDELAINVILIGLGTSEEVQQLKHTLIQLGVQSLQSVLDALQKADTLRKSDNMGTAGPSALSARHPQQPTEKKFYCKKHGKNKSHNTSECRMPNGKAGAGKGNGAKAASEKETEAAMAAGIQGRHLI